MAIEKRTIHQIVLDIVADAAAETVHLMNADTSFVSTRNELEEELKTALLDKASVKTITVVKSEDADLYVINRVNVTTDIWEDLSDVPAGKYSLVPRDKTKWLVEKI
jgi:frataxin-like iron-binding protein CyaY